MSLNEPPAPQENRLEALKARLNDFIERFSITQFEGDDIVQLIEEGESIDWIVDQLKANSPALDTGAITALLNEIRRSVAPDDAGKPAETQPAEAERMAATEYDTTKIDLSQIADMLPPGVRLPPNLDVHKLMETPQGKMMADFLLFCQERGIPADEGFLDDPRVQELRDEWSSTPRDAFEGRAPAEVMSPDFLPQKVETYRRAEPRVGRNDPCPCGSGKKYKKCCGREK